MHAQPQPDHELEVIILVRLIRKVRKMEFVRFMRSMFWRILTHVPCHPCGNIVEDDIDDDDNGDDNINDDDGDGDDGDQPYGACGRMDHCYKKHGQHIHQTVPHDQPKRNNSEI